MTQLNTSERIWKYNQVIYAELLDEIEKHFRAINVRYLPIKGAYLICAGLAEKIPVRRMDDIDILVMKEDFDRVCDYFAKLPEVTFLSPKWYFEKELAYSICGFTCYLEIHWLLNFPARFHLPTEELFGRAHSTGGMRFVLSREDAVIVLLCHALVHIAHEVRWTLFEEISLLSSQEDFSWTTFWRYAKATGVEQFFYFILLWYKKEKRDATLSPPRLRLYALFMACTIGMRRYALMPKLAKRIVFELPFVKDPVALMKAKWSRAAT